MITLNFNNADSYVENLQHKGVSVWWEGWDIIFFTPSRSALSNPNGSRLGNQWGFTKRVSPNDNGEWLLPHKWTRVAHGRR